MIKSRDYWIETSTNYQRIVENVTSYQFNDGFIFFYRGLDVIFAIPTSNVLFFGSKERVSE